MATRSLGLRYANYESGARGKVDIDAKLDMTVLDLKKIALDKWPEGKTLNMRVIFAVSSRTACVCNSTRHLH